MTAVQTSHAVHSSMSFSTEIGLSEGPFLSAPSDDDAPLSSSRPLPLPSFVFPARGPPSTSTSAPSSFSRSTGRRPMSAVSLGSLEQHEGLSNSLPPFSFGNQLASPPLSPRNMPTRPGPHKRGTSEFIGGDGTTGAGQGPLSTSPTKGDDCLPKPNLGPPGGRGHKHRRSAAISCGDISMILKPNPVLKSAGSSAPSSPQTEYPSPLQLDSAVQPSYAYPDLANTPPARAFKGSRVGFSDDVQIIPRPLSVVSSDSASTIRAGHSVSNSMSSIVSTGTSSPLSKEKRAVTSNPRVFDSRPRTAEPILCHEVLELGTLQNHPKRRGSLPLLMESSPAHISAPSTPRSAKRWTFFGHDTSGESSPKSRPTSASSSYKEVKKVEMPHMNTVQERDIPLPTLEPCVSRRTSISRKPSKKQKKVKIWAGSILSRKSRQRTQKKLNRRSPTPPLRSYTPMDDAAQFDFNQSKEEPEKPQLQTDFANWKPRKIAPQEDSMSPIIDLDAALGPFNTPSSFGEDWNMSQRGGTKKRAMHSAAGLGGFTGPGMHYHRRAESAPEFENPRFALHRLGSSSTMADVFEEDEDEEWEDTKNQSDKDSYNNLREAESDSEAGLGIDINVLDSDGVEGDKSMDFESGSVHRGVKRKGSGLSEGERRQMSSSKSEHSTTSLADEPIREESSSPVDAAEEVNAPRPSSAALSDSTPTFRPISARELPPVEVQPFNLHSYQTPTSPPSTTQSSFPSPRSPFSYDTQRISTAPSSIADENAFHSLLMGEPGPELRMSVDESPSLLPTREGPVSPPLRDGQRSASFSAAVSRKRSSMASLSRLISSSHGERSKLSIESRVSMMVDGETKEKASVGKRVSRLMQFWKAPKTS